MTLSDPKTLQNLTRLDLLLNYLRDVLGWPIETDTVEDSTFEYSADELNLNARYAARITSIKQLRPLVDQQVWGIFFIEFDQNHLPVMALRRILNALALSRRTRATSLPAWKRDDLLFICVYTSAAEGKVGQRGITFAHFRVSPQSGRAPELRTFSWDSRETHFYYLRNLNLNALRWPPDDRNADAWRDQWRRAFINIYRYTIRTSEKLAGQMAKQARIIRELVDDLYAAEGDNGPLHRLYERLRIDLIHDLQPANFGDMIAQTITSGVFSAAVQNQRLSLADLPQFIPNTNPFLKRMLETLTDQGGLDLDELGVGELVDLLRQVDLQAIIRDFGRQTGGGREDPVIHFYEQFLKEYDPQQKTQRGVFYTPDPVVEYMVRAVDQILQRPIAEGGFGIKDGLASDATAPDGEPLVQILDPATGTGTFLAHIIDHIADRKNPQRQPTAAWNDYVSHNLLKRLNGFELMMAPYTIAHLKLALKLFQTGYNFGFEERLRVFLTNTLEKPTFLSGVETSTKEQRALMDDYLAQETNAASVVKRHTPIMVVIGNPPYSGHSANQIPEDWFKLNDYYFVDGKPLGERNPKWLQDDYVKFIRFGQWRIEQTGEGVLAFITNHGYLDNPTFRGMRQQLMSTFDLIYILDLHGNARKKESNPSGSKDENVFDIQQGVAIALFIRQKERKSKTKIFHRHVWGIRETKYEWLLEGENLDVRKNWSELHPYSPFYLFVTEDRAISVEYIQGWRISELLPVYAAGMVTARDSLTVQFSEREIRHVVQDFASLPSEVARQKYSLGQDVRDWKVSLAQDDLNNHQVREDFVAPVHYRPFDFRFTYYTGQSRGFICMPRPEVMGHMLSGSNLGLISARSNKSDTMNHFLVSRFITEAKTGEATTQSTLFPLYLYPNNVELFDTSEWPLSDKGRRPNLSKAFVNQFSAKLGLEFITDGRGDLHHTFGPEDVFHYAYAVFHSPTYRTRYAEQLKIDFPRLPLTDDVELFRQLVMRGVDLVALHLLEDNYEGASWKRHNKPSPLTKPITRFWRGKNGTTVGAMSKSRVYDRDQKRIYLDTSEIKAGSYFEFLERVSAEEALAIWEFQIGGYQVLHKWLYDRRALGKEPGRTLTDEDLNHYQRVVVALYQTRKLMASIDEVITAHGGFPLRGSSPEDAVMQPEGEEAGEDNGVVVEESVTPDGNEEEETTVSDSEWREPQPRLVYVEGDQLPLGHEESNQVTGEPNNEDIKPPDTSIEITPLEVPTVEDALTQSEGLEVETEDSDVAIEITKPFDPSKIRMTSQQMSLDILIKRMRDKRISIPSYQRSEGIWNDAKKSRLIESILIRIPIPAFYIDASDDDNWRIIDGLQRLTTLRQFIINKTLRLKGLDYLDLHGQGFDDLPRNLQRRIEETQVTAYFVQEGTPPEVTYNIFKRINTGGEALSAQEIRNALKQGPASAFLDRLAKSPEFLEATEHSIKPLRRADQEVVLRFIAFALSPDRRPPDNDIDGFMTNAMDRLNQMKLEERQALERRFRRVMTTASEVLGEYAFRKIMPSGRRGQISRALFDAWALNFDAMSDEEIARLAQKRPRSRLLARFKALLNEDTEFNRAITASTGDPARVQYRYNAINRIIQETLGGTHA